MKKLTIVLALALLCGGLRGWEDKDLETLLGHINEGMATRELVRTAEWRAIVSPSVEDIRRHGTHVAGSDASPAVNGVKIPAETRFMKEGFRTLRKSMVDRLRECEEKGDFDNAVQLALGMLSLAEYRRPLPASLDQLLCLAGPIYRLFWNGGLDDRQRRVLLHGARARMAWTDTPENRRLFAEADSEEARRRVSGMMGRSERLPDVKTARLHVQQSVVSREAVLLAMESWLDGVPGQAADGDGGPAVKAARDASAVKELFKSKMDRLFAAYGLSGSCECTYSRESGEFTFWLMTGDALWVLDSRRVHTVGMDRLSAIGAH